MTDTLAVLLVEPDARLATLVSRYLERHAIRVTVLLQRSQFHPGIRLMPYTCVIVNEEIWSTTNARDLCEDAGVPIIAFDARCGSEITARLALGDLVRRIRGTSTGSASD